MGAHNQKALLTALIPPKKSSHDNTDWSNSFPLVPAARIAGMQKKLPFLSSAFPPERKSVPRPCAGFLLHFQSRHCKLPFAVCICTCEENGGLQRERSLCRWVSNRGASCPVGTRFCAAKSSVFIFIPLFIPLLPADAGKGLAAYSAVRQSVAINAFSRQ